MLKIIADNAIPFLRGVFEPYAQVTYLPGAAIAQADLKNTDALIIRTRTKCNAKLLAGSGVRIIASATIGMDHVNTAECEKLGIRCVNAPGCNASSVAQYIVSILTADAVETGKPLAGRTLGIVGVGHVGKRWPQQRRRWGCGCCGTIRPGPGRKVRTALRNSTGS